MNMRLDESYISLRAIENAFDDGTLSDLIADYVAFGGYIDQVYEAAKDSKLVTKEDIDRAVKFLQDSKLIEDLSNKEETCYFDESVNDGLDELKENNYSLIEDIKINEDLDIELKTVSDLLDGAIGNMPDEQLDDEINFFQGVAKELGVKNYNNVIVAIDSSETEPDYVLFDGEDIELGNRFVRKYPSAKMIYENLTNYKFLYFKTEKDAQKYFTLVDEFLNPVELNESFSYDNDLAKQERKENPIGYYTDDGVFKKEVKAQPKTLEEALDSLDRRTGNKYDLLNDYLCANLPEKKKKQIVELLYKSNPAENIHKYLHEDKEDVLEYIKTSINNGVKQGEVTVEDESKVMPVISWLRWNDIPYDVYYATNGTIISWYTEDEQQANNDADVAIAKKARTALYEVVEKLDQFIDGKHFTEAEGQLACNKLKEAVENCNMLFL